MEPVTIGLTGGIACGKSTIARILRRTGAIIIDADLEAKRVVKAGSPAWRKIVNIFGEEILNPDNSINRKRLGNLVFGDPARLEQLNNIVHPETLKAIEEKIHRFRSARRWPAIVLDAPLLFEANATRLVDVIWVVQVDSATQINRLMKRDGITRQQAVERVKAQMPLKEKIARADAVIDNTGTRRETREQVAVLWNRYIKCSQQGQDPLP